jgi:hypothetical protein
MNLNTFKRFFAENPGSVRALPAFARLLRRRAGDNLFTDYERHGLMLYIGSATRISWSTPPRMFSPGIRIDTKVAGVWAQQLAKEHLLREDLSFERDVDSATTLTFLRETSAEGRIVSVSFSHWSTEYTICLPELEDPLRLHLKVQTNLIRCRANRKVFSVVDAIAQASSERAGFITPRQVLSFPPTAL